MVPVEVSIVILVCSSLLAAALEVGAVDFQLDPNKDTPSLEDELRNILDNQDTDLGDITLDAVKRSLGEAGSDTNRFWKRGHYDEGRGDAFWKRGSSLGDKNLGLNNFWKRGRESGSSFWKRAPFMEGQLRSDRSVKANSFWKRARDLSDNLDGFWKRSDNADSSFWKRSKETPQLVAVEGNPEPILVARRGVNGEVDRFWKRAGVPWNMLLFSKYRQMYSHPEEGALPPNNVWIGPKEARTNDHHSNDLNTVPPKNRRQGPKPNPDFNPTGW